MTSVNAELFHREFDRKNDRANEEPHQCACCGEECPDGRDCCSDDFPEPADIRETGR